MCLNLENETDHNKEWDPGGKKSQHLMFLLPDAACETPGYNHTCNAPAQA